MTEPDSPRILWRIALPAYVPSILASIGIGAVLPVLVLSALALGADEAGAALLVAVIGVGSFAAALPAAALVARVGERPALVVAALVQALGMVLAFAASTLWVLAVAVLVAGSSTAVFNLARQSYLTGLVPLGLRARALSTLGGVHRIGLFIGPLLGAVVIEIWGIGSAYLLAAVVSSAAGIVVIAAPDLPRATAPTPAPGPDAAPPRRLGIWEVMRERRRVLLTLGTGVMAVAAARACRVSLVPLWAASIGLSAAQTSLVFGVAAAVDMLLFYPAGSVMDRFGRAWIAVPCVVILGLGMLALPLTDSLGELAVVAIVLAVGNGIGSGIVMTLGSDAAPPGARPQFLGGWRLFTDFGTAAAPLAISGVTALASLTLACVVAGGGALLGAAWLAHFVPRYDPRRPG